jgi:hypothetical protein
MLNGAGLSITINGQATATGVLTNTATVDSNESDAVTSNNIRPIRRRWGWLALILARRAC